jgi:soluble lytic murein transglycosylase-like protein
VRAARVIGTQLRRRGVALAVGLPIACGALGFPTEAMNITLPSLREAVEVPKRARQIFASSPLTDAFFPKTRVEPLTLDVARELFFTREVPYGRIIYHEAQKNRLPPELVAAVVEAESDFRPRLVSNKNAQGLMQIVPETSRILGCDDPFDPSANIAAGAKYLRYLMDRFGDQRLALAAYNAGEGAVERFGGIPPFGETQDYVIRVSRHTATYRQHLQTRVVASLRMSNVIP